MDKEIKEEIEDLKGKIEELELQIDEAENNPSIYEDDYDEHLNDCYGEIDVMGINYPLSEVLKEIDFVRYNVGLTEFIDEYIIPELKDKIEEIEDEIEELKGD